MTASSVSSAPASAEPAALAADHVLCPVCQADDFVTLYAAGVAQENPVVKCRRCGMMYANPRVRRPDIEHIVTFDPNFGLLKRDPFYLPKHRLQVRDFRRSKAYLAARYPKRGKLIEIGSATGFLLDDLRADGWDVEGIEPHQEMSMYCEEHFKIKSHQCILEDVHLPDASVDVAIMIHVIEHVPDPRACVREVFRILKPGGTFVVETPRYDTLMFKLLGRRERSLSCSGHIHFFTNETLSRLGRDAGFVVDKVHATGRSVSLARLAWNVGVMSKSKGFARLMDKVRGSLHFDKLWFYINVRDMQRQYWTKPA